MNNLSSLNELPVLAEKSYKPVSDVNITFGCYVN